MFQNEHMDSFAVAVMFVLCWSTVLFLERVYYYAVNVCLYKTLRLEKKHIFQTIYGVQLKAYFLSI